MVVVALSLFLFKNAGLGRKVNFAPRGKSPEHMV